MAVVVVEAAMGPALEWQIDLEVVVGSSVPGVRGVPVGPHRLSLLTGSDWHHAWLRVDDPGDVAVLRAGQPSDALCRDPRAEHDLAGQGLPDGLRRMPSLRTDRWEALTANLRHHLPELAPCGTGPDGSETVQPVRRHYPTAPLDLAGHVTAAGGAGHFLADVEKSFLDGFLTPDTGDLRAIARWRRLVGAITSGGSTDFARWPALFPAAVETLRCQIDLLGADLLDDSLVYELDFLAAELLRAPDPGLGLAGLALDHLLGR